MRLNMYNMHILGQCRSGVIEECPQTSTYLQTGFLNLQKALDTALIRVILPTNTQHWDD